MSRRHYNPAYEQSLPAAKRQCSFRYMVVALDDRLWICTQDQRRSKNALTGKAPINHRHAGPETQRSIARQFNCGVIFRLKELPAT